MGAVAHVLEESLGVFKLRALRADPSQPLLDDLAATCLSAVEHASDLGEAHSDASARLSDAEATDVLVRVLAMTRGSSVGDDDAHVVPVPQDMGVDTDHLSDLSDLHSRTSFPLDFRST